MALKTRVYQRQNKLRFDKILIASFKDIYASRFLARQLAVRDIATQYRQSFLGIIWAFIGPLSTAFVWVFLNSSGTVQLSDTGIPYPVYAFTGTLIWSIIIEAIMVPMVSTNASRNILTKINFPKEALVFSGIYKMLFNSLFKILLLIVLVVLFGIGFSVTQLVFPLVILAAIFIGLSIGLLITPFGMLYTDISRAISFLMKFLMYATPVVYAVPKDGLMKTLMEANPLTPVIITARDMVTGMESNYLMYFLLVLAVCLPLFLIGLVLYRISIPIIVERLSA